jgi:uncharacterized protein HemX
MKCIRCKFDILKDDKYCESCGAAVGSDAQLSEQPAHIPETIKHNNSNETILKQEAVSSVAIATPSKSRIAAIVLILTLLVVIAGGIGVSRWVKEKKENERIALAAEQLANEQKRMADEAQKLKEAQDKSRAEEEAALKILRNK